MKESHMPRRRIRKWVNRFIRRFVKATGVDRNDAAALRVARFFGLIYAAGCLGKLWGILPSNWRIGRAVIDCYHAHLSAVETTGPISAFEQMLEYMRRYRHEIIDLRSDKRRIDDATFAKAPGFLNAGPRDTVELQIPPHRMRSEFPKDRTYR
jgi:hypothetical protein